MLPIIRRAVTAFGVLTAVGFCQVPTFAQDGSRSTTYADIEKHFGTVPRFFTAFPEYQLPTLWNEYKKVHLNADTVLDTRMKHLIALAVAAEAGCQACIYFHASAAFANGVSFKEVQEAVAVFAIEDSWSKVLTEDMFDIVKRDTDALVSRGIFGAAPKPLTITN